VPYDPLPMPGSPSHPSRLAGSLLAALLLSGGCRGVLGIDKPHQDEPDAGPASGGSASDTIATNAADGVVSFGTARVAGTPVRKRVEVRRSEPSELRVELTPPDGPVTLESSSCDGSFAAGEPCHLDLIFSPQRAGAFQGALDLSSTKGAAAHLSLEGTGAAELRVNVAGDGRGRVVARDAAFDCDLGECARVFTDETVNLEVSDDGVGFFCGWAGACSGRGECSVLLDGVKSVEARFCAPTDRYFDLTQNDQRNAVAVDAGGRIVLAGWRYDERVQLGTVELFASSNGLPRSVEVRDGFFATVAVSPSGQIAAGGSLKGTLLRVYDASLNELWARPVVAGVDDGATFAVAFDGQGQLLAPGTESSKAFLESYDASGKLLWQLPDVEEQGVPIIFMGACGFASGGFVVGGFTDQRPSKGWVRTYAADGTPAAPLVGPESSEVRSLACDGDDFVLVENRESSIARRYAKDGELRWERDLGASVFGFATAAKNGEALVAAVDGASQFLTSIDARGDLAWTRRLDNRGSVGNDVAAIAIGERDDFFVAGARRQSGKSKIDGWLRKYRRRIDP
jgi:hypothetical protein